MKIGIFVDAYSPYISGVVTSVQMLELGLKNLGHEVFIFTVNIQSDERITNDNVLYFEGKPFKTKGVSHFRKTSNFKDKVALIKKYNLDAIHLHTEFSMAKLAVLASKKLNIPMVYTFHTLYEDYLGYAAPKLDKIIHGLLLKIFNNMFIKKPRKQASVIVVPTIKVDNLKNRYKIKSDTVIIPTGINIDVFKEKNDDYISELKMHYGIKDEFIFLSLGRISAEKSLDKVVSAFAKVHDKINAKLVFVGTGPYIEPLKKMVEKFNLLEKVVFTNEVPYEKVKSYFHLADVVVNASTSETQGLTYIESLASGKPLLVQEDEATKSLVIDNVNAFIFDGVDQMAQKMLHAYDEKENLEKMIPQCFKSVEKYSHNTYAKSILALYEKIIK